MQLDLVFWLMKLQISQALSSCLWAFGLLMAIVFEKSSSVWSLLFRDVIVSELKKYGLDMDKLLGGGTMAAP